jgi:hypothetical protein
MANNLTPPELNEFAQKQRLEALTKVGEFLAGVIKSEAVFKQVVFACNLIFSLGYKAHKDELAQAGAPEEILKTLENLNAELTLKSNKVSELEAIITRLVEKGNQDAVREFILYRNKKR